MAAVSCACTTIKNPSTVGHMGTTHKAMAFADLPPPALLALHHLTLLLVLLQVGPPYTVLLLLLLALPSVLLHHTPIAPVIIKVAADVPAAATSP